MNKKNTVFDIIRFTASPITYYGASINMSDILLNSGQYAKHTSIDIPLGISRYGGPIVDMPPGTEYPPDLYFAMHLDLTQFAPYDKHNQLPKSGQLLFFAGIRAGIGKIIYADIPNTQLVRTIKEHDQDFYSGIIVDKIYSDIEIFKERFSDKNDPDNVDSLSVADEDGEIWDDFAGSEKSKIFGIYTNCQLGQEGIEEITFSNKILLLQIGQNGFNDEGVFSVLIDKDDLRNKNFSNCSFNWAQS